jgi:hypothetical protein
MRALYDSFKKCIYKRKNTVYKAIGIGFTRIDSGLPDQHNRISVVVYRFLICKAGVGMHGKQEQRQSMSVMTKMNLYIFTMANP